MQRGIEAALCLLIMGLLVVLVVPWRNQVAMEKPASEAPSQQEEITAPDLSLSLEPVDAVATLFVGRKAPVTAPVAAPAPKAVPPTDEPWLKYLGFASGVDGASWWYIKDTKRGKLIRVSSEMSADGWKVVENQPERLVVRNGDSLYSVSKR